MTLMNEMSDGSVTESRQSEEGHKQIEEWAQGGNNNEALIQSEMN